jgi:transposase
MTTSLTWVGIDVSASELVVHIRPTDVLFAVPNTPRGTKSLFRRLAPLAPTRVVCEATGGYERLLLTAAGTAAVPLPLVRVNPRQVRDFARSCGILAKTDGVDARVLSLFAERVQPPVRALPDAETQHLAALVTRRRQLLDLATMERNRLRQATPALRPSHRTVLRQLTQEVARLDPVIATALQARPDWADRAQVLGTAPGVGPVLIQTLLALLPELGTLSRKEIAKLVGVAPMNRDSGKHQGRRRCTGGRGPVRAVLYMATLCALQHNPTIRASYHHLLEQGGPAAAYKKIAIVACMRKLLVRLNAMVRDGQPWQEVAA